MEMRFKEGFVVSGTEHEIGALIGVLSKGNKVEKAEVAPVALESIPAIRRQRHRKRRAELSPRRRSRAPNNRKQWTEDEKLTLAAGFKAGNSLSTVARALGRSKGSVIVMKHHLRKAGVDVGDKFVEEVM